MHKLLVPKKKKKSKLCSNIIVMIGSDQMAKCLEHLQPDETRTVWPKDGCGIVMG